MSTQGLSVAVFSQGIFKKRHLKVWLGAQTVYFRPNAALAQKIDSVVGWGNKKNTKQAREYAAINHLPYWTLEDGFIHSSGQGVLGYESCSMVVDRSGIYYDARQGSDLEQLLLFQGDQKWLTAEALERAKRAITRLCQANISKYNNTVLSLEPLDLVQGKKILVVDQTAGDLSLEYGLMAKARFADMLQAALDEHPQATILVKTHPDVIVGKKQGCLSLPIQDKRVQVITEAVNPLLLLKQVEHVYVGTSQLGFEALLLGKSVTCYGLPFYAGWGITDDRVNGAQAEACLQRRSEAKLKFQHTVESIFLAAYMTYSRYIHPDSGQACELEEILSYFEIQHDFFSKNQGDLFCLGFTLWKRNYIRRFLQAPGNHIHFIHSARQAQRKGFNRDSKLIMWSSKPVSGEAQKLVDAFQVPVWRMEDGFIRSAGLGSDFVAPASLIVDTQGVYYDPNQPSDLEILLQQTVFSEELLKRAVDLRVLLLESELSKYNLGGHLVREGLTAKAGQRIILVPGQVEDDASIQTGCRDIRCNADLLQAVKAANEDAFVIFKPHPDVVSGNRKGHVDEKILAQYCDQVLDDISITDCLRAVDEVHTMTSLVGFEGLLRELKVVCYGIPFYAGWGLTEDRHRLARRQRSLLLDELVAATLLCYPRYINWDSGMFTSAETVVKQLREQIDAQGGKQTNKISWLQRQLRKLRHIVKGVFYAK